VARTLSEGRDAATRAALVKDLGTRFEQDTVELVADLIDSIEPQSSHGLLLWRLLATARLHSPLFTLRGGTNEVLRGVVAKGMGAR
jgi:acyl-CoA dehydrogenase